MKYDYFIKNMQGLRVKHEQMLDENLTKANEKINKGHSRADLKIKSTQSEA
jgi:hypothetical protein